MPKIVDEREMSKYGLDNPDKRQKTAASWDGVNNYIDFCKEWNKVTASLRERIKNESRTN